VIHIRPARRADAALVLGFIRELAEYERLAHQVVATPADLERSLFGDPPYAYALIAETAGEAVGFAVYFFNFSTFMGRPGLYLEDLFVRPTSRGHGIGRALLRHLAALALERGCGRLEWAVLDWNEPAIRFYRGLGACANDDWTIYRVTGEALAHLAAGD
jgi:GNAT superfamily N-acetyltransferase